MNINDFARKKLEKTPITMITCYDYWTAKILASTNIDTVLVGDSLASVMHGYDSTVAADCRMMEPHVAAVRRGLGKDVFVIADMPFLSYRISLDETMRAVDVLMKAGGNAIKLEGLAGNEQTIKHIVESGVPVMGHIGFTPQSVNMFGKSYVRGRDTNEAQQLVRDAQSLEECGCFAIVLECMPAQIAKTITESVSIATIGIGAGPDTSGQVLVLQDLLGANPDFNPKFLKKYLDGFNLIKDAVNEYCADVEAGRFPNTENCYKG